MSALDDAKFLTWLKNECGYRLPTPLEGGRWVAILPLMFTSAIVSGCMGDYVSVGDRWCYHSWEAAELAMLEWDGTGEPAGWHRHPPSGRRRDPETSREWVAP